MKKLAIIVGIALAGAGLASCHFGHHSTIVETGNNYYLRIEYAGRIHFNDDCTGISRISKGGYVKYEFNGKKLEAENNGHGGVTYKLDDHGEQLNPETNGKDFIADAVKMMLKKNHHYDW